MISITEFLVKKHTVYIDDSISIDDLKNWYLKSFKYKNITFNQSLGHVSKLSLRGLCNDETKLIKLKDKILQPIVNIITDIISNKNVICFFFATVDSYKIKFILNDKDDYIEILYNKINDSYKYTTSKSKKKRNYNEKTIKNEIQQMIN